MKRFIIISLFTMVLLAGCATPSNTTEDVDTIEDDGESNEESSTDEVTSLKFWRVGTDQLEGDYWRSAISEYEEATGVTVELQEIPSGTEFETKLNVAYASGTAPDALKCALVALGQRASLGQFESLDGYMDQWDAKDDYIDGLLKSGEYKGSQYGLPLLPDPRILVWRKDYFEEAGLNPEQPPTTWEELEDYASQLVVSDNGIVTRAGFDIPVSNAFQQWQIFATQNEAELMDVETDTPLFNSPEGIEAAEFLDNMVAEKLNLPYDQLAAGAVPFVEGKAAIAYASPKQIIEAIDNDPTLEDKIGFSGPLTHKVQGTFCGAGLMVMNSESDKKDEAFDYINFIMSPDQGWKRNEMLQTSVVFKSLEEQYIEENPEFSEAVLTSIKTGTGAVLVPYAGEVNKAISLSLEEMYYDLKTPEEALNDNAALLEEKIPNYIN